MYNSNIKMPKDNYYEKKMYYNCTEIKKYFSKNDWQSIIFNEFSLLLLNKFRLFPCTFGIAGLKLNQLRFCFLEILEPTLIAKSLEKYIQEARNYGANTSFIVISKPNNIKSIEEYHQNFWYILKKIAEIDKNNWPYNIPTEIDKPEWEFCFAGEPMFVVCNTPAHVNRQSRRSSSFMITFQPRWLFSQMNNSKEKNSRIYNKIRQRIKNFDFVSPSPDLGYYGDKNNREFKQYFLNDINETASCPFKSLFHEKSGEKL